MGNGNREMVNKWKRFNKEGKRQNGDEKKGENVKIWIYFERLNRKRCKEEMVIISEGNKENGNALKGKKLNMREKEGNSLKG